MPPLSQGAFGAVYKRTDQDLNTLLGEFTIPDEGSKRYVVKVFTGPNAAGDLDQELKNYEKLAEKLAAKSTTDQSSEYSEDWKQYFVQGKKLDNTQNKPALYMEGCSPTAGKHQITLDNMVEYYERMLYVVKLLHNKGLAHMDVKAENFVYCEGNTTEGAAADAPGEVPKTPPLKMIDFGTLYDLEKDTYSSQPRGTPGLFCPGSSMTKMDAQDPPERVVKLWRMLESFNAPACATPRSLTQYFNDPGSRYFDAIIMAVTLLLKEQPTDKSSDRKNTIHTIMPKAQDYYALAASMFQHVDRLTRSRSGFPSPAACQQRDAIHQFAGKVFEELVRLFGGIASVSNCQLVTNVLSNTPPQRQGGGGRFPAVALGAAATALAALLGPHTGW